MVRPLNYLGGQGLINAGKLIMMKSDDYTHVGEDIRTGLSAPGGDYAG